MELDELKKRTIYQHYDELGGEARNSKSQTKLQALNFNPKGLDILDVGCNTGYFPIKYSQQGAKSVIGIDVDKAGGAGEDVIEIANEYKRHFGIENVEFRIQDFFDTEIEDIDAISCLSVFHYFRERQPLFFEMAYNKLRDNGIIIWEGGLSQTEELEKYSRGVDEVPCYFPSRKKIEEMAKGFKITYEGKSINQKGDNIPRFVLHFQKI